LRLRTAQAALPPDSGDLAAQLESLVDEATGTLDELGELARGIHPVVLAEGGLCAALEALVRRSAVPAELDCRVEGRVSEEVEMAAYYVVAEALTNSAKHAEATMVQVQIDTVENDDHSSLHVEIHDNGRGGAALARGTGLLGLKDRVEVLDGRLSVNSPPAAGTTIRVDLPLTAAGGDL
jgi:signal transduction histidine kinase